MKSIFLVKVGTPPNWRSPVGWYRIAGSHQTGAGGNRAVDGTDEWIHTNRTGPVPINQAGLVTQTRSEEAEIMHPALSMAESQHGAGKVLKP